ncbi:MAG TPA: alpha/beta hydrolase [Dehalococcoidia bacterium]|nr:alpha/beta hydrolase [Dehalococcoidia bacterium]|tara:strand:- start:1166 stop:1828 length:663 start_codon:yes stop_codon:yes gene_type:complete
MWQRQIDAFSDRYRVIAWDMRGHGETDSPTDLAMYSEPETVADMNAILDASGVDKAVIGGLSLGGYMSLAFNLVHPERTRALMLFDTGPGFNNPQGRKGWNQFAIRRAEAFETDGLAALGGSPEVKAAGHRSAEGLAKAARGMLTQRDASVIQSLTSINKPTLVVTGADDRNFLAAHSYMSETIPGAMHFMIDNAGHSANIDQPEAFNVAVEKFLKTLPS